MNSLLFIHPSDELYGADRMLLEMVDALPPELPAVVWLPTDLAHPEFPLCEELVRRGVIVRHMALPILRRANRRPRELLALVGRLIRLRRELRATHPQAVYCTTSSGLLCAPVARAAGIRVVFGHVQEIWSDLDRRILTLPARACTALFAISTASASSLPDRLRRLTTVIPNATPEPGAIVAASTDTAAPLKFLVASRWNGWKGHRTLLAAWDRIDSGQLLILGGPPPSGSTTDVVSLVAALRRPESVTILGEVPDPSPYLADADVVIIPSDRPEPFGLVAIEAFARARPVIASAAGGLLDIVTPGQDGWLFPPGDAAALAEVISGLTHDQVARAGAAARVTYEARYTSAQYAARWWAAVDVKRLTPSGRGRPED